MVVKSLGGTYSPFQIVFFANLFGFPIVTLMLMRDPVDGNLRPRHPWWTLLRTGSAVMSTTLRLLRLLGAAADADLRADLRFAAADHHPRDPDPRRDRRLAPAGARSSSACSGCIVVLRPGASDLTSGHLAALGGAVFSAIAAVVVRKIGHEERSAVLLLYPMVANFLIMGCALPFVYQPMPAVDLGGLMLMACLGFLGALCHISAYRAGSAVVVAPMQYSQILWAVLYGAAFFGETPDWSTGARRGDHHPLRHLRRVPRGRGGVSKSRPVLETRSRFVTGTYPRISSVFRLFRRDQ